MPSGGESATGPHKVLLDRRQGKAAGSRQGQPWTLSSTDQAQGARPRPKKQNPWVLHSPLFLAPCVSSGVASQPSGNSNVHVPGSGPCRGSCKVPTPTPGLFPQTPLLKPAEVRSVDCRGGPGFSFQVEIWSVSSYFLKPTPTPALSTAQMNLSRLWPGLPQFISTASLPNLSTSPFPLSPQPKLPLWILIYILLKPTHIQCQVCSSAPLGHLMSLSCFPGPAPKQGSRLESRGSYKTTHGHEGWYYER